MKINVRYFAAAREAAGNETETLDVQAGSTVRDLQELLEDRYPALQNVHLRFAVGQAFADSDQAIEEGDDVALIPPVSGG